MRMRGARLAEVDEQTYLAAAGEGSSATDRKLYYQRAGVWEENVGVMLREEEESLRDLVGRGFERALERAYGDGDESDGDD
jgi:hypothetical protein